MRCAHLTVLLAEYADEVVDARGRRIVERHLELCALCSAELKAARKVRTQLRRLVLLPPGVSARLPRYQRQLEARFVRGSSLSRRRPQILLALVLFLLLEAGVVWLLILLAG